MSLDLPGFADPVRQAQAAFRAVLDAVARPGTLHRAGAGLTPPAPLSQAAASVLLALVDAEAPLWIAPAFLPAHDWLAFHCGARLARDAGEARFVLAERWPGLGALAVGSDEAPEDGATVLLQVARLGAGRRFCLEGPGLRAPAIVTVDGLPDDFAPLWAENHARFPRGIDLVLCAGDTLAALPRSVAVAEA